MDFTVPADHRLKLKESENRDEYLDLSRELKKLWNMKETVIPIVIGALGTVTKGLLRELGNLEMRTNGNHPNYSIVEIDQNTKKGPGNLRKLVVIQTPMENWKVELTAGKQTQAEEKIQKDIFLKVSLSPLLFAIAMITLNYLLRKFTRGFKFKNYGKG